MDQLILAYALVVVFIASIVRGFSGFGFSLLAVTALSLVYPAREIVPSIFLLEVAASLHLLPSVWKEVHWRSLLPLTVGCLIATPIGVWALASFAPAPMQLAMAVFVLICVALMAWGFALKSMPNTAGAMAAGAASGLANGAFGIGGPPVVLFYFATPAGHVVGRATLIVFFLLTDVIGLANQSWHGLVTLDVAKRAATFLPVLLVGVWLGQRSFKGTSPETFRKAVLALMAVLAVLLGVTAIGLL